MSLETSLDEVLQSLPCLSSLPFDVAEAIARLSHIDLEDLVDRSAQADRQLSATQLVAGLDDGSNAPCSLAWVLLPEPTTLQEFGEELAMTPRRVSQLLTTAPVRYRKLLAEDRCCFLRWRIFDIARQLGGAVPECRVVGVLGAHVAADVTERPLLLWLAGPFVQTEGWLVRADSDGVAGMAELHMQVQSLEGDAQIYDQLAEAEDWVIKSLDPQELQIFGFIGEGLSNREIGERMFLAENTIKNYTTRLYSKLGTSRRSKAAALAARIDERDKSRNLTLSVGKGGGRHDEAAIASDTSESALRRPFPCATVCNSRGSYR